MINRQVIRTRVLQVAYAHLHRGEQKLSQTEGDLRTSLGRSHDLYLYLLRLPLDLTEHFGELQELRARKHLSSATERQPNRRLQHNQYVAQIARTESLEGWYLQFPLAWSEEEGLLRHLVERIEASELYQDYLKSEESYESDRSLWVNIFSQILAGDERLAEYLEAQSIYWDDERHYIEKIACEERPALDAEAIEEAIELSKQSEGYHAQRYELGNVEIVKDFVLKSMKRALEGDNLEDVILPEYKGEDDESFALHLLRQTLVGYDKASELISKHLSASWDKERLADMDDLLMHLAITEFLHFPAIPTSITINEYVELAKHYSTSKSSAFINGVLDTIAKELIAEGKILKK